LASSFGSRRPPIPARPRPSSPPSSHRSPGASPQRAWWKPPRPRWRDWACPPWASTCSTGARRGGGSTRLRGAVRGWSNCGGASNAVPNRNPGEGQEESAAGRAAVQEGKLNAVTGPRDLGETGESNQGAAEARQGRLQCGAGARSVRRDSLASLPTHLSPHPQRQPRGPHHRPNLSPPTPPASPSRPGYGPQYFCNDAYLEGLADCLQQGLCQAVGVSNFSAERIRRAVGLLDARGAPLASNQVRRSGWRNLKSVAGVASNDMYWKG
jgi:hypothetical protein